MITTNILQRTFRLQYGGGRGTCFTIDVDNRQYIITAKHVAEGISANDTIEIYQDKQWQKYPVSVIGVAANDIDVIVLSTDRLLSPNFPLPATNVGIIYSQDVYFLGFPYDLFSEVGEFNRNFPLPFVKKGILANIVNDQSVQIFYIDGHNNPGFSGGPVVFTERGQNNYKVAAIISGFRAQPQTVYHGDQMTPLVYYYNTGIIVSYGIQHALDIIQANPTGFQL
jgi:hypothetical protein